MTAVIDRVVQYPNRFKLTDVSTGAVLGTFDLDAVTGAVSVVGTKINKALFDSIATDIEERIKTNGGDVSATTSSFTIQATRDALASGETISVSMGKIYKWLSDLKALAFKDNLSKEDVGLDKVDNTSDKEKPISDLTQAALDKKQNSIPSITLAASQAISQNPIKIQLTDEQYAILSDNFLIILDATALGMTDKLIFQKNYNGLDALSFSESIIQYSNAESGVSAESVVVDSSTKIATLITHDLSTEGYVAGLIDGEIQMRTSADEALQANITAEANTRSSNDATLQSNIDSEASIRSSADALLLPKAGGTLDNNAYLEVQGAGTDLTEKGKFFVDSGVVTIAITETTSSGSGITYYTFPYGGGVVATKTYVDNGLSHKLETTGYVSYQSTAPTASASSLLLYYDGTNVFIKVQKSDSSYAYIAINVTVTSNSDGSANLVVKA